MGDILNVYSDIVWVKLVYPDNSQYIFRGTASNEISLSLGLSEIDDGFLLDLSKRKFINITMCDVSYYKVRPNYERGVDEFASRFV